MSRKAKYSIEQKITASEQYLSGRKSAAEIAAELGMSKYGDKHVREWAARYRENGVEGFHLAKGNNHYTAEMKQQAVEEYLRGEGSLNTISRKYKIPSIETLRQWILVYHSGRELREYDPKPEVYAAMRKQTTLEERKEIVAHCMANDRNYKATAAQYDVSYGQVYDWVKRYMTGGEAGLEDKRGQRKNDDEVDELERLRRENKRLKQALEDEERLVLLLKKVKEYEGK